ncbi:MAG: 1-(5-phosphoribosyl)-5-[(5-phosphoribosylamino)methylideneamino]imidazole-4-carboxamide isomerase [Sphaerochaeta sp.]
MLIFPAVDILEGKAVRLLRGDYDKRTVYSERPWEYAEDFVSKGCTAIHIVDLDGARTGIPVNLEIVKRIAQTEGLFSEVGGGVRDMKTVEKLLNAGVSRVILGTAALKNPAFLKEAVRAFSDKIAVGVDIKQGNIAVKGWIETSDMNGFDFIRNLEDLRVDNIIVTDISRDGAMSGANTELYSKLSREVNMKITASGGVSSLADVHALRALNLYGSIIGKAYYNGSLRLEDALEAAK